MELRTIRETKGLSIATIAGLMGVAENTVSRWETGTREPDINSLKKLAQIYDCTLDELVNGQNPTVPLQAQGE